MKDKIIKFINNFDNIIPYLFFGVCTTLLNVAVYWVSAHVFEMEIMVSTVIAWTLANLFAYVTNRKFVFKSNAHGSSEIIREIIHFFLARLATGFVDWALMFILVKNLGLNDLVIKLGANFLVIVLNYVFSKKIVFAKK